MMHGRLFVYRTIGKWIISGLLLILAACSVPEEKIGRAFFLVVDVSGSMATGEKPTIERVKNSIPELLGTIHQKDSVTLLAFSGEANIISNYVIEKDSDRDLILNDILSLDAIGSHTDMKGMLRMLRKSSEDVKTDRERFLIILSDGMDDPAPGERKDKIDLSDYRAEGPVPIKKSYVYYVNLGKLNDPALTTQDLKVLSTNVKVIEGNKKRDTEESTSKQESEKVVETPAVDSTGSSAEGTPDATEESPVKTEGSAVTADTKVDGETPVVTDGSAMEQPSSGDDIGLKEVAEDIEQVTMQNRIMEFLGYILVPVLLLILAFILLSYFVFRPGPAMSGQITYWESGQPFFKNDVNLDKFNRDRLSIGAKTGANLKIRDLGEPGLIVLRSAKKGGEQVLKPVGKSSSLIHLLDQKGKTDIGEGDQFKIGNYIFEYSHGKK